MRQVMEFFNVIDNSSGRIIELVIDVSTKLEVSTAFLLRANLRHTTADRRTDANATFNAAPKEGRIIA